jgi:hypothetical protein
VCQYNYWLSGHCPTSRLLFKATYRRLRSSSVFLPHRVYILFLKSSHIATERSGSQAVSLGVKPRLGLMIRYLLLFDSYGLVFVGAPSPTRGRSIFCICCWPSPEQSFSGPSTLGLTTILYCLSFETFLFVAFYDSQGHGGGIRPRLHTGVFLTASRLMLYIRGTDNV